jgi:hypothetical protein
MIKFYSNNLVDQAVITASTENAQFPVENLQDHRRTKVFRSTSNSSSVIFDLQETSLIDSIIIVDEPRNGFGISTVTLQLNGTSDFSSPAFTQAITLNDTHGIGHAEFAEQSYRFARLVMTSTLGYCELSKVFIGQKIQFENNMGIDLGWTYQDDELSIVKKNRYSQRFVDVISRIKSMNFSIRSMNADEFDQIMEIYDEKGKTKPFYVLNGDDTMVNDPDRFAGMFFLETVPSITNKSFGLYDISMNLEEAT